jgi:hypothetical protein
MFSSLSSYIWGSESSEETNVAPEASYPPLSTPLRRSPSPDDWVLVGPSPAPGNLTGALDPLPVCPSSPSGTSTPASSEEDEMEESEVVVEEEPQIVNRGRPNNPAARVQTLATAELKQVKQSQIQKQRTTGKALSSKALKRNNKAMMAEQGKKSVTRQNFNIKMAGNNKNLKQC